VNEANTPIILTTFAGLIGRIPQINRAIPRISRRNFGLDAPGCRPKRGAAIMASHFMDELEQFASDVREYATEVRRMGYSPVAAGDENPFLELSDRMIRRGHAPRSGVSRAGVSPEALQFSTMP
jgi:hypothetical protein